MPGVHTLSYRRRVRHSLPGETFWMADRLDVRGTRTLPAVDCGVTRGGQRAESPAEPRVHDAAEDRPERIRNAHFEAVLVAALQLAQAEEDLLGSRATKRQRQLIGFDGIFLGGVDIVQEKARPGSDIEYAAESSELPLQQVSMPAGAAWLLPLCSA